MSSLTFFCFCSFTASSISISSSILYDYFAGICFGITMGFFTEFSLGLSLRDIDYFYLFIYFGGSLGTSGSSRLLPWPAFITLGGILFCEFLGSKICLTFCWF